MRKRNKVAQLGRTHAHRKAMLSNMAVSLLKQERIKTTRAKAKALRSYIEPLINRAKKCANAGEELSDASILHHKRQVMKHLRNWDIVMKLFADIGVRYKLRDGGYVRLIQLVNRRSDAAQMMLVELTENKLADLTLNKPDVEIIEPTDDKTSQEKKTKKKQQNINLNEPRSLKGQKQAPWFDRFMRKKTP